MKFIMACYEPKMKFVIRAASSPSWDVILDAFDQIVSLDQADR